MATRGLRVHGGRGLGIRRPPHRDREPLREPERAPLTFAPEVPWDDFLAFYFNWQQGEHVTMVGPTGGGKTTLALEILPERDYVLAIATKQRDPVLYQLESMGYLRVDNFETPPEVASEVVLQARLPEGAGSINSQKRVVADALLTVYRQGGWCVYLDEIRYITDILGLTLDVELLWQQGRSAGISVVGGTQRPAWVPLSAFSQATHLFFWRTSDRRDLERIGALGAHDSHAIAAEVAALPLHDVLYVNTRDGSKARTRVT